MMRAAFDRRRRDSSTRCSTRSPASPASSPQGAFYAFPSFAGVLGRDIGGRTPDDHRRAGRGHPRRGQGGHRPRRGVRRARATPGCRSPSATTTWSRASTRIAELLADGRATDASTACRTSSRTAPGRRRSPPTLVVAGSGRRSARSRSATTTSGGPSCARARAAGSSIVRQRPGGERRRRAARRASRPAPGCTSTAAAPGGCTTTRCSSPTGPTSASTGSIPTPSPAVRRRWRSRPSRRRRTADRYADGVRHAPTAAGSIVRARAPRRRRRRGPQRDRRRRGPRTAASRSCWSAAPDFVAVPRVSPDGRRLCWLQWDHPDMPWDGTELWVADLADDDAVPRSRRPRRRLAGGRDESIVQPEWDADGGLLVRLRPHRLVEPLPNRCRSVPDAAADGRRPLGRDRRRDRRARSGSSASAATPSCPTAASSVAVRRATASTTSAVIDPTREPTTGTRRRRRAPATPRSSSLRGLRRRRRASSPASPDGRAGRRRGRPARAAATPSVGGRAPGPRPRARPRPGSRCPSRIDVPDAPAARRAHALFYPPTNPDVVGPDGRAAAAARA